MFYTYFLLYFIYSIIGWFLEVGLAFYEHKKFVNRGFLIGPYCPIYGVGCLLLTILLSKYINEPGVIFAFSIFICATLEYLTSYLMEKIFKLRWWDYSNMKFNINGRICLETLIPFGIIGVLVVKYISPFLINTINSINFNFLIIINIIILSILITDILISFNVVFNLKNVTRNLNKDSTEEIKKAIYKFIHNNIFMYNRIVKAFPNMKKIINEQKKRNKDIISKIKKKKTSSSKKD